MSLKGVSYVTEEATYENGVLYDAVQFEEEGFKLYKLYIKDEDAESIEEMLKMLERDFKFKDCKYLKNDKIFANHCPLPLVETTAYENYDSLELMRQLTEIEKLDTIYLDNRSGGGYEIYYYPKHLIYEINNMAVKLPRLTKNENKDNVWLYEYLIYPNFTVNVELLNELRNITGKALPLSIENVAPNMEGRGFSRFFSMNLFKRLYIAYIRQCNLSKGINNAIIRAEHQQVAQDELYEIYQKARAHKRDTIKHVGYEWSGPIQERTFKEICEDLDLSLVDIGIISQDPESRLKFIEEHKGNISYEPIIEYILNVQTSPYDAMENYHKMQAERCYIRKLMFQLNMCWYDDFNNTIAYINEIQPSARIKPSLAASLDRISWIDGETGWGINKYSFDGKRKKRYVR